MKALSFGILVLGMYGSVHSAEVFQLGKSRFAERPGGKEADAIVGDFVLRSDKIEAVISGDLPLRRANMGAFYGDGNHTPGCLYDLTRAGEKNDQLTIFSPCVQKGDVTHVKIVPDRGDGSVAVETFISAETSGTGVDVTHEYRLKDGWEGLLISSSFHNKTDKPVTKNIHDHWTQMRVNGKTNNVRWADAIDPSDKAGYAFGWVKEDGAIGPFTRVVDRANGRLNIELAPGEKLKVARFFAAGRSPVEAIGFVAKRQDPSAVSAVQWNLATADKTSAKHAKISFQSDKTPFPMAYPDDDGVITFSWFAGDHSVSISDMGRETIRENIKIESGTDLKKSSELSPLSEVVFSVTAGGAETPCKVQFQSRKGTDPVNLGPTDRAHGCKDQWHSETGTFRVPLPPGEYQIVVTRGPEYSRFTELVTLKSGEKAPIKADLERVVETEGWISADFHNHSTPSGDNVCGTNDRIINLAAEHIEFAPTTEHNRLYDWEPHIVELGLEKFIKTVPGMELTGRGAHLNCFPLTPEPEKQDAGAPVWNKDPRISALSLWNWQKRDPDRWVHLNHPNMSENFVDRDKDGTADGGFAYFGKFLSGLETQNYRASHILRTAPFSIGPARTGLGKQVTVYREFVWLQLLNQGMKVWGVGVADAHHVHGNGVGSWRTFIPSSTDEPSKIDWREISKNARAGKMVLSSGPFLEVETEKGTIAGGEEENSGPVKLKVKVQCPVWMGMDRVQVLVNGAQVPKYNFTKSANEKMFREGSVRFDETLEIELEEDAHIIVVAIGEKADLALWFGTSGQAGIRPCAYNNPIFIDTDGNGFQPNGDTLGYDLPVGRLSVQKVEALLGK